MNNLKEWLTQFIQKKKKKKKKKKIQLNKAKASDTEITFWDLNSSISNDIMCYVHNVHMKKLDLSEYSMKQPELLQD